MHLIIVVLDKKTKIRGSEELNYTLPANVNIV
jgi:hypothetical protein